MPELEKIPDYEAAGTDVTAEYKDAFIGTWDGDTTGWVYEFKANENLVVTASSGETNYTYWFEDTGSQVRLCIFENGAEEAQYYSFTKKGDNITLYDVTTGSAVDLLVRRVTTPAPSPTVKPTATAAPAPSPTPAPPSPTPTLPPTPSPSPPPTPAPPSPTPTPELPEAVKQVMPKVECVLDVMLSGGSFSQSGDSFWNLMARYASQSGYNKEDGYVVLTPEEMLESAKEVYAGLEELQECPEDSNIVIHDAADEAAGTPEQYRLLLGNLGDMDITVQSYNGMDTLSIRVRHDSNAYDYEVKISCGAIASITAK